MIIFSPVRADKHMLRCYRALFSACFPPSNKFSPTALEWLYADNPDGHVVGFDAFDGDHLAAHYACIPTTVRIDGSPTKALLSLNTATHPNHQGKGLFTKLADMTYEAAAEQGFHSVHGVANANSTPGFLRKLGFQLIQPLEAMIGFGQLAIDFPRASRNAQFERIWTPESLRWRCANPANPIARFKMRGKLGFHARAFRHVFQAYAELPEEFSPEPWEEHKPTTPMHLYLGLVPEQTCNFSNYARIPQRLRPSPLNLVFRSLAQSDARIEAGHVHFSFLDFDAY